MGVLLSYLFIFLVECGLMVLQMVGAFLFLLSMVLFIRHFTTVRKRRADGHLPKVAPVAPYVFGGIGFYLLIPASGALFVGKEWGLFGAWVI